MAGNIFKLGCPEVAAIIDERYAAEPDGWGKRRLLAIKLAAKAKYTPAEVAKLCGVSRSYLFLWLKRVREGGLDALLARDKPGPKEGMRRGIQPEVIAELGERLATQQFASAAQARRWLKEEHGIERPYVTVWSWLKKFGGVLRVPRPSHSKKNPDATEGFKSNLAEKLEALGINM